MKKLLPLLIVTTMLAGCAAGSAIKEKLTSNQFDEPVVESSKYLTKKENRLSPPAGGPIPVAVYSFQDKTGQRKYVPNVASFSTAVTQGAEGFLIKALQDVGDGRWFTPLERVGLENLIKERQMIRQMREAYQGREAKALPPMLFAGVIMEGAIVGYDSNVLTGGNGMRIFGIGATTQYQSDSVTINLRTVSVSTGEILTNTTVTKTVLSYMDKLTLLRFVNDGTNGVEGEVGGSINESVNRAIDVALQAALVNTITEGARKGHWAFKEEASTVKRTSEFVQTAAPVAAVEKPKVELIVEPVKNNSDQETAKKEEVATTVSGKVYLKVIGYLHKEATDKSTKSWQLPAGTELTVLKQIGEWIQVQDGYKHRGWVLQSATADQK